MHGIFLCLIPPHSYNKPLNIVDVTSYTKRHENNPIFGIFSCKYNIFQILDRITLQYAPNASERKTNECFARTIRKTHDTRTNERTKSNERTIRETQTNERTIHERTNHWSVTIYYPMTNDSGSIEVQYSIMLLFEWLVQIDVINWSYILCAIDIYKW